MIDFPISSLQALSDLVLDMLDIERPPARQWGAIFSERSLECCIRLHMTA